MIEPKPISESQFARLSGDPWAAVRRIAAGSHFEALGETAFPGSDLPSDESSRPAVGFLYGALLAQAAGHTLEAEALFAHCLELLADRRPSDDLWLRLTAFAAIGSAKSATAFEAFLAGHDMLDVASLAALSLPARSNFLRYCLKHGRLGYALGLVEQAMPNDDRDGVSLEAWGFRLAVLSILDDADRREQFAVCAAAYQRMLQSGLVDPPSMRPVVEVRFAVRLAEAARNQGDARSTIANYRRAIALIEAGPAPGLSRALLVNLLQRLARIHQSVRYFPETQRCLERSIGVAAVDGYKYDLVAGFFALANALEREGRYADAVALQARRLAVMENDKDFTRWSRQSARHDLARALLANGEGRAARHILADVIAFAQNEPSHNQALLISALLTRAESNLAQGGSVAAAWHDVDAILGLKGLSANQLEPVSRYLLQTANAAGQKPPRDLVDRLGELAEQMPQSTGAVISADVAGALLHYYGDSAAAENLIRRVARQRDALADQTGRAALTRGVKEVKFQLLQHELANKSESDLARNWNFYFEEAASLSRGEWHAALSLAVTLNDQQRHAAAGMVLKSIADYFAAGRGDSVDQAPLLVARLSELTLRIVQDPREAAALAQQGLALLTTDNAEEGSAAIRQRLLEGLTAAELAGVEALLATKAVPELRAAITSILARGAALGYANRFGLLRLVDRLFQEPLPDLGGAIIGALTGLPPPEQSSPDRAQLQSELYLRLSQASLRHLQAPREAAGLAQQGLDALPAGGGDKSSALRGRLVEVLSNAEIAICDGLVEPQAEAELRRVLDRLLARAEALTFGNRFALLRLAGRLFQEKLAGLGATIIDVLAALPAPAEPDGEDGARLQAEAYLRLSQMTLRFLAAADRAAGLTRQGLDALPEGGDGKSSALRGRLVEALSNAEIAICDGLVDQQADAELRRVLDHLLARGAALTYGNRFALLRLAGRLFQEKRADLGTTIVDVLTALPMPAEPVGEDGARLRGEAYLRLSQVTQRFLQAADRAAELAQRGLDALAAGEGDEKSLAVRQRLLESLTIAEVAIAEALLENKAAAELREMVARIIARGRGLSLRSRLALLRLAERAFIKKSSELGAVIVAGVADLPVASAEATAGVLVGDLYLRLSNLTLRFLELPARAAELAQQGLDALAAGKDEEKLLAVKGRLSEILGRATGLSAQYGRATG